MLYTYAVCDICGKVVDIAMGGEAYKETKKAVCMMCESCWETFLDKTDDDLEEFFGEKK